MQLGFSERVSQRLEVLCLEQRVRLPDSEAQADTEPEANSSLTQLKLNGFFMSPRPSCINAIYEKKDLNYSETQRK